MKLQMDLQTERIASIFLMVLSAGIMYAVAIASISDIAKEFIAMAVNSLTFSQLANLVFISAMYVFILVFALVITSIITFRDRLSVEYALYSIAGIFIVIFVLSGIRAYSIGFLVDISNWVLLPTILLIYIENPANFLILVAAIYIIVNGSLNYLKRDEV